MNKALFLVLILILSLIPVGTVNAYKGTHLEVCNRFVSDYRVNVNGSAPIQWRVRFSNNKSDCTSGYIIVQNRTWAINGSGWAVSKCVKKEVGKYAFSVESVNVNNLTDFKQLVKSPEIVFDRISLTSLQVSKKSMYVGNSTTMRATAKLDYDGHILNNPEDSFILNDFIFKWSSEERVFRCDHVEHSNDTLLLDTFTSGHEDSYGISAGYMNGYNYSLTWNPLPVKVYDADIPTAPYFIPFDDQVLKIPVKFFSEAPPVKYVPDEVVTLGLGIFVFSVFAFSFKDQIFDLLTRSKRAKRSKERGFEALNRVGFDNSVVLNDERRKKRR